jgi:hypothetical protein
MHETSIQTEIRRSTEPLHQRVERLENIVRDMQILCEVAQDHAWKDPECSALFTSFVTKMNSLLKRY